MIQRTDNSRQCCFGYLNAGERVSGGRGSWRHKCTLTKGCTTIHNEGYFRLKWHRSGAGRHSHATEDGPDCLKFYANDTCLSEFRGFSTLHPVVHLSYLMRRFDTITTVDIATVKCGQKKFLFLSTIQF